MGYTRRSSRSRSGRTRRGGLHGPRCHMRRTRRGIGRTRRTRAPPHARGSAKRDAQSQRKAGMPAGETGGVAPCARHHAHTGPARNLVVHRSNQALVAARWCIWCEKERRQTSYGQAQTMPRSARARHANTQISRRQTTRRRRAIGAGQPQGQRLALFRRSGRPAPQGADAHRTNEAACARGRAMRTKGTLQLRGLALERIGAHP
jgi:hypothetical protein